MPSQQAWEEAGGFTAGVIVLLAILFALANIAGWLPILVFFAGAGVTFLFMFLLAVVLDWWWGR